MEPKFNIGDLVYIKSTRQFINKHDLYENITDVSFGVILDQHDDRYEVEIRKSTYYSNGDEITVFERELCTPEEAMFLCLRHIWQKHD